MSSFFHDLAGLIVPGSKLPVNINYHSKLYYGSYAIRIIGDHIETKRIPDVEHKYNSVKAGINAFYRKHYKKGAKNILVYAGHSTHLYSDALSTKTDIFNDMSDIHLLIFDSCYTSHFNMMQTLIGRTKYVIACEAASPFLGFLSKHLIQVLNSGANDVTQYRRIIDDFIIRNSPIDKNFKTLQYRTDAALIDMKIFKAAVKDFDIGKLKKSDKCRLEDLPTYIFYDVICAGDPVFRKKIKECILYYRMNDLNRKHYEGLNRKLHGMSISL
jgi:hypothetical protein